MLGQKSDLRSYLFPLELLPLANELQQQPGSLQVMSEAMPLLQLLLQRPALLLVLPLEKTQKDKHDKEQKNDWKCSDFHSRHLFLTRLSLQQRLLHQGTCPHVAGIYTALSKTLLTVAITAEKHTKKSIKGLTKSVEKDFVYGKYNIFHKF